MHSPLVDIVGLIAAVLTVVALFFAGKQFKDAHAHTKKLADIQNALTTRFLGKYPAYVKPITELIKSATKSICIVCDYPGYCSFSDHLQYERYRTALREKVTADPALEKIKLAVLDREHRAKLTAIQFRDAETDWRRWKLANKNKLELLMKAHKNLLAARHASPGSTVTVTIDNITPEDFLEMLEADDRRIVDDLGEIGVDEIHGDVSIHFWIVDGRNAIFAIPSLDDEVLEWGFSTSDHQLITALERLAASYARRSSSA